MISKEIIATQHLSPVVETIFHWRADDPSHCLLRIYIDELKKMAFVVTSELYSDRVSENFISADFGRLAQAVCEQYPELLSPDRIKHISWIAHYGSFSVPHSYENLGKREDFSQIDIPWPLPGQLTSLGGEWTVLRPFAQEQLSSRILLEPVSVVRERVLCGQ